jgi:hypothetical protein
MTITEGGFVSKELEEVSDCASCFFLCFLVLSSSLSSLFLMSCLCVVGFRVGFGFVVPSLVPICVGFCGRRVRAVAFCTSTKCVVPAKSLPHNVNPF